VDEADVNRHRAAAPPREGASWHGPEANHGARVEQRAEAKAVAARAAGALGDAIVAARYSGAPATERSAADAAEGVIFFPKCKIDKIVRDWH
jgi:hypothetical protein